MPTRFYQKKVVFKHHFAFGSKPKGPWKPEKVLNESFSELIHATSSVEYREKETYRPIPKQTSAIIFDTDRTTELIRATSSIEYREKETYRPIPDIIDNAVIFDTDRTTELIRATSSIEYREKETYRPIPDIIDNAVIFDIDGTTELIHTTSNMEYRTKVTYDLVVTKDGMIEINETFNEPIKTLVPKT